MIARSYQLIELHVKHLDEVTLSLEVLGEADCSSESLSPSLVTCSHSKYYTV